MTTESDELKHCGACGEDKPLSDFYRMSKARDGHQARCKLCSHADVSAWKRDAPVRARAQEMRNRSYREDHERLLRARPEIADALERGRSASEAHRAAMLALVSVGPA